MADIIRLLPDSVANQIAAGEVIQRPSSVVKELVENAIDAGATRIQVIVKDGGKSSIQVIDNGCGMSGTDARMAFERHATSKIQSATDLYAIRTMGFRGEALASIAAIAEVELKTRMKNSELGTRIVIEGSEVKNQEPVTCSEGSVFTVRNLFFNVPARRKFLKTDATEMRHIIIEFQRIALANPMISFSLTGDDEIIYQVNSENILKRIVSIFGKSVNQNLFQVNTSTKVVEITGYVGKPEFARKNSSDQFFFVNNRFMKHPYFHRAVLAAYEKVLPPDLIPSYFLYFEVDPSSIDINIHPTKTEIKFEDERTIWQILQAAIKQSLGKFNVYPSLNFDQEMSIEIPSLRRDEEIKQPEIRYNPEYNPFKTDSSYAKREKQNAENWEVLLNEHKQVLTPDDPSFLSDAETENPAGSSEISLEIARNFLQLKNKYILLPVKSGLMIIDQHRAHERILYEQYMASLVHHYGVAQQNLFPQTIELNPADYLVMKEIIEDICKLGFDIRDFGKNSFVVYGCPAEIQNPDAVEIITNLINVYKETKTLTEFSVKEKIAMSLAKASAITYGRKLTPEEMQVVVDQLFACSEPRLSPSGKPTLVIRTIEDIEKWL